ATAGALENLIAQRDTAASQPLTIYDRHGQVSAVVGEPGTYSQPTCSPDGTRIAVVKVDGATQNGDIFVIALSTGTSRKITGESGTYIEPTWSPDGKGLAFISRREGAWRIYRASSSMPGTQELLYQHQGFGGISDLWWSSDGRF